MKKILVTLLALTLTLLLLCSCGGTGDGGHQHADTNTDGKCDECNEVIGECTHENKDGNTTCDKCGEVLISSDGSIDLIVDGEPQFQFVITNAANTDARKVINGYVEQINEAMKNYANRVTDVKNSTKDVEIIIGSPLNRGDEYKIDEHQFGYKGFAVKVLGTKVLVIAGSANQYEDALEYLVEEVFGIKRGVNKVDNLTVTSDINYEKLTENYFQSIKVGSNDVKDYVIAVDSKDEYAEYLTPISKFLQDNFYITYGAWLEIVDIDSVKAGQKAISLELFENNVENRDKEDYKIAINSNGNIVIECKFPDKIKANVEKYFNDYVFTNRSKNVTLPIGYSDVKEHQIIYYIKDFGAKGDGETDDYFCLQAAHDYANKWGHTVMSDLTNAAGETPTYFIGHSNNNHSIVVQTDTYLNGCNFIFNDLGITSMDSCHNDPIYLFQREEPSYGFSATTTPFKEVRKGATKLDWAPGKTVMIIIYSDEHRHFIREGVNEDNGSSQHELLLIHADGTIDESTPLQWDYTRISSVTVYDVEDTPIVFSGGSPGTHDPASPNYNPDLRATVTTIFNEAVSAYTYFGRNFLIERSNVFFTSIKHVYVGDAEATQGAPYTGFTKVTNCNNVTVDNLILDKHKGFSTEGNSGGSSGMGSYELSAGTANDLTWQNCVQSDFFNPDGSVFYNGTVGTNFCKNLTYYRMFMGSFDAHCGTYNANIIESWCEHLNFIGAGKITIKDSVVYADANNAAMLFRQDYGATWDGEVYIDGLEIRSTKDAGTKISLIRSQWTNHYFGYECFLPEKIHIKDTKIVRYQLDAAKWKNMGELTMANRAKCEIYLGENTSDLNIFHFQDQYNFDIHLAGTVPPNFTNDYKQCNCHEMYPLAEPYFKAEWIKNNSKKIEDLTDEEIDELFAKENSWLYATNEGGERVLRSFCRDTDGDGRCNNYRIDVKDVYDEATGNTVRTYKRSSVWCWGFEEQPDIAVNVNPVQGTKKIYVENCGTLNIVIPQTPQFMYKTVYYRYEGEETDTPDWVLLTWENYTPAEYNKIPAKTED